MQSALDILRHVFGFDAFRGVQGEIRDPAGLSGLPRSDLRLGDESTGGRAAEEAIDAPPGESGTEIPDRTQG